MANIMDKAIKDYLAANWAPALHARVEADIRRLLSEYHQSDLPSWAQHAQAWIDGIVGTMHAIEDK